VAGISVAYSSVHQSFQIALAAQELGQLDCFYCSILDAPGKWGSVFARVFGKERTVNRRLPELDARLVREFPWPLAREYWRKRRNGTTTPADWEATNSWFDRWSAAQLRQSESQLFVGVESCARRSLEVARDRGMTTVLDCHQTHPYFLDRIFRAAADDLQLPVPADFDTPTWREQKLNEFAIAERFFVYSEVQKRSFVEQGFDADKIHVNAAQVVLELFYPPPQPAERSSNLRVLFVGALSLRKGVPYLLKAIASVPQVDLTLIGTKTSEIEPYLQQAEDRFTYVAPVPKSTLREHYWHADLLVLPSLVDTFGYVAIEAMACGLPVLVSDNCGVPVPDPSWRIPVMDAEAIACTLLDLDANPDLLQQRRREAVEFARHFTADKYRDRVKSTFVQLLA